MENDSADKLAMEMARAFVADAFPLWKNSGRDQNGDSIPVRGPFWGNVDFNDEAAVRARLEEMTSFIGQVARKLQPR